MDLEMFKLLAAVLIFVAALMGAILAKRWSRQDEAGPSLSVANCFAGGVFLAAGLIHVLPDAQGQLASVFPAMDYPLFGLLATASVALMVMIDQWGHSRVSHDPAHRTGISAAVLFLVLSIHSVITGFALGIEGQGVAAMALLIAVLAHKGTATFALALKVAPVSENDRRFYQRMIGFALTTPVGVLMGFLALKHLSGQSGALMEGVFDALAAGTFVYVALFEILPNEFKKGGAVMAKSFAVVAGAGLMALVAIWT